MIQALFHLTINLIQTNTTKLENKFLFEIID